MSMALQTDIIFHSLEDLLLQREAKDPQAQFPCDLTACENIALKMSLSFSKHEG